jgi:metal-dependent amidase/aminoacylase/carboxypeptidase family protein
VPATLISSDPTVTGVGGTNFLAYERWIIEYFGKPTHASASPWNGINAYDAAVAAHNNIGLLRQQLRPVDRVHGCMIEGPKAANVIGEYTKLTYIARSDTKKAVAALEKRVLACFEASALATGCEVKITRSVQKCYDIIASILTMV